MSASPPHPLEPTPRCRSPNCVPAVASAPPRSMSGSPCSAAPAASSKPTADIASPTADPKTSDNHKKTGANARLTSSRSQRLQRTGTELGSACVSGHLGRRGDGQIAIHHILWFGPAEHSPVPAAQSPCRRAQRQSRPARFRAAEGVVLTAASTMARWRGTGTADHHYAR